MVSKKDKTAEPTDREKAVAARKEAFARLINRWGTLHTEQAELLEEARALLAGKPGMPERVATIRKAFDAGWAPRHGGAAYVWNKTVDEAQIRRLLAALGDEEVLRRIKAYLRSSGFHASNGHTFGLFVGSVNQWAQDAPVNGELDLAAVPADCKHDPPCASDEEHTRRKMADMRGGE